MEKRRHYRHKLTVDLEVFDTKSENFLGSIADLSEGGMQLLAEQPLPLRQRCWVTIKPSEFKPLSWRNIRIQVMVRWIEPETDFSGYRIGCEYLPVASSSLSVPKQIDHSLGFDPCVYRIVPYA